MNKQAFSTEALQSPEVMQAVIHMAQLPMKLQIVVTQSIIMSQIGMLPEEQGQILLDEYIMFFGNPEVLQIIQDARRTLDHATAQVSCDTCGGVMIVHLKEKDNVHICPFCTLGEKNPTVSRG